jgi:hypothetical protein
MNFEGVSARVLSHNETLSDFIYKHTTGLKMYKGRRKRKRENLQEVSSN